MQFPSHAAAHVVAPLPRLSDLRRLTVRGTDLHKNAVVGGAGGRWGGRAGTRGTTSASFLSLSPSAAIVLQRHDGRAARVSEVPAPPQTEASATCHRQDGGGH